MLTNKYYGLSLLDENNEHIFFSNDPFKGPVFYLKHGTEYKILITNQSMCRANAHIFVDGKEIGSFRIESNGKIIIERPANDQKKRKLTFFDISSNEAKMGQIETSSELGKLVVKIEKEKIIKNQIETDSMDEVDCADNCSFKSRTDKNIDKNIDKNGIGGTALGRVSNQLFGSASYMPIEKSVIYLESSMLLLDSKIIPL
ncbi:MAG: hypothetical protein ACRCZ0_05290 [Cetobacterium sp.]